MKLGEGLEGSTVVTVKAQENIKKPEEFKKTWLKSCLSLHNNAMLYMKYAETLFITGVTVGVVV